MRKALVNPQCLKDRPPEAPVLLPDAEQIRRMDIFRAPHLFREMLRLQECEKPLPVIRVYLRPGKVCGIL